MMKFKSSKKRYGLVTVTLHWLTVFAVVSLFVTGLIMTGEIDSMQKTGLYRFHVGAGMLMLLIVILRCVWVFIDETPDPPEHMTHFRLILFKADHYLIYAAMFIIIATGIGTLVYSGLGITPGRVAPNMILTNTPPSIAHGMTTKCLAVLAGIHVAGVLSYQLTKSDVLSRMGITWFNRGGNSDG